MGIDAAEHCNVGEVELISFDKIHRHVLVLIKGIFTGVKDFLAAD